MDDSLKYFLENTRLSEPVLASRLSQPISQRRYPKRLVYERLEQYASGFFKAGIEPRLLALAGLRGLGKTTLLWQVAEYIFRHQHQRVYVFNVNVLRSLGIDLHLALEVFQSQILGQRFNTLSEPIALFFDEVQDDAQWTKTLKILYDEARTAFILCTGSSALLLNSTADLSRRMHLIQVFPFSFTELLHAKKALAQPANLVLPEKLLAQALKETLFFSETVEQLWQGLQSLSPWVEAVLTQKDLDLEALSQAYLQALNFPNLLFFEDELVISQSLLDLVKRIIHEDIPKLKPSLGDLDKVEKLLLRLAGSDEVNLEKLSGLIGLKQNLLNELMDLLAKAELLNVLVPFGGLDSKIIKQKKAFFMSPSLRRALLSSLYGQNLPEQFQSKLLEDLVVMYLKRLLAEHNLSFVSGETAANPDLVIETRDRPILLEIGRGKTTLRQLRKGNINYRYGLLLSQGIQKPSLKEQHLLLPWTWFLLL